MSGQWYYTTNRQRQGPISWEMLKEMAASGAIKSTDLVWTQGMGAWIPADAQPGLAFPPPRMNSEAVRAVEPAHRDPPRSRDDEDDAPRRRYRDEDDFDAPRRRRRQDDDDDDVVALRRRPPARGMSGGTMGLLIGGGILLLLLLIGGGILIVVLMRNSDPNTWSVSLNPGNRDRRTFQFTANQRVTVTVATSQLNADVDIFVFRNQAGNPANLVASNIAIDPSPRLTFVVPANGDYIIEIHNAGRIRSSSRITVSPN